MTTVDLSVRTPQLSALELEKCFLTRERNPKVKLFEDTVDRLKISPEDIFALSVLEGGDVLKTLENLSSVWLWNAGSVLTGDVNPFENGQKVEQKQMENAYRLLINTSKLVNVLQDNYYPEINFEFDKAKKYYYEGLWRMNIKWNDTRILETLFFVDNNRNLVIGCSKRHNLDDILRSFPSNENSDEKKDGDKIIRKIENDTGMRVELFGAVFSSLLLSQKMDEVFGKEWTNTILYPEYEQKWEFKNIKREGKKLTGEKKRVRLESLERGRPYRDFRKIFESMGINVFEKTTGRFFGIKRNILKAAFERYFTDDANHPNRFIYRKEIYRHINPIDIT